MSKYTIGIDYGSLSGRAVVVDVKDGKQLSDCVMDYPHAVMSETLAATGAPLPADYALQDPRDYLDVLETIIPGAIKSAGIDPADIIGAGVDFTCGTMLPVRADGTPLCFEEKYRSNPHAYVKLWKHHAAQPYADRLNAIARERGETWLEKLGGKISCEWMFPKIWEILAEAPEIYAEADYFIEAGDWLTWQLTGKQTRGYGFAACKSIYMIDEGGYPSEDFFAALDERLRHVIRDKMDAPIVFTGEAAGYVSAKASAWLGLPEGAAVACPMPDAHTAAMSLGLMNDGDMCAIMGTSSCYMLISEKDTCTPGICGTLRDTLTPGFYGNEAGLCCVGDHFAWAKNNVVTADYIKEAEQRGISVLKLLIEKAAAQKVGQHGLIALNWFNGNRNILVDSSLSGMFVGLTLRTKPEDIMRALIEATAYGTRVIIENFRAHNVYVGKLIAAGGIARKDPFTMQVYADILNMDINISESTQAPALAGAVQAASAAGEERGGYATLREAMQAMSAGCDKVYHPIPENVEMYNKLYAEYVKLHDYFGRGGNDVMKTLRAIASQAE
ncbi:MAG: ribulokinase [Clostridia bacterium]|nr:ribulokinase [Clostridia bacterium]